MSALCNRLPSVIPSERGECESYGTSGDTTSAMTAWTSKQGREDAGRGENAKEGNEPFPFVRVAWLQNKNRAGSAHRQIICHARYEAA